MTLSYKDAGVDKEAGYREVKLIKEMVKKTFSPPRSFQIWVALVVSLNSTRQPTRNPFWSRAPMASAPSWISPSAWINTTPSVLTR